MMNIKTFNFIQAEFYIIKIMMNTVVQEDKNALNQQLIELIKNRYSANSSSKFDFQYGEISAINTIDIDSQIHQQLHQLLSIFLAFKIQNGYCYFKLQDLLFEGKTNTKKRIEQQIKLLSSKKSDYHKIHHLIVMREVLMHKLQDKYDLTDQLLGYIDDVRFINEEIIKSIRLWRANLQEKGVKQVIVYLYKSQNYLTKMIIDNQVVLANLNSKKQFFSKVPNPFFLTVTDLDKKISIKQINTYLQLLSDQKAIELKMIIESPFIKVEKKTYHQKQQSLLRNRVEDSKLQKIKTIYQSQKTQAKQEKSEMLINQDKINLMTTKNEFSIKNLDKLIKIKQIQVLKEFNKKKVTPFFIKKQEKDSKTLKSQSYTSKIQNLKAQITKNSKLNDQKKKKKQRIPKSQSEIKASRPKIHLISEKQSMIEEAKNPNMQKSKTNLFDKSILLRSKSTFYKQINASQDKQLNKKQGTALAQGYSSLKNRKLSQSNIRFSIRKSSKISERQKSKSREQQIAEVSDSLMVLNRKIRQQAIKSIYSKGKKSNDIKQSRISTVSKRLQYQETQSDSIELNTFNQKIQKKQQHISQLKKRLLEIKEKNMEQQQIKIQNNIGMSFESNDKIQKQRQILQLQNLKIQQQMKKQQIKFLTLKQKEYELRQAQMQNKYKFQFQKIKQQLQLKNKQWQLKIFQQQKKNKESIQKMEEVKKKSEIIAFELQQKQMREQLIAQIEREQLLKRQKSLKEQKDNDKANEMMEEIKKQQQKYKNQLERKAIQSFQQQKLKLNQLYIDMKKKNEALQVQNMKRHEQLQKIEQQKKKQLNELEFLQSEINEKQKQKSFQSFLQKDLPIKSSPLSAQQIQQQIRNEQYELQQLKERVKLQLIQQIKRKKKQQQQEEKQYYEQRNRQIAKMEQQMRRVMKEEEQGLLQIQQEYKLKNEEMMKKYQEQLIENQMQKQRLKEQADAAFNNLKHSQPFQVDKLVAIQTGLEDRPRIKRSISSLSVGQDQNQNAQYFIEQKQKKEQIQDKRQQNKQGEIQKKKQLTQQQKIHQTQSKDVPITIQNNLNQKQSIQKTESPSKIQEKQPQYQESPSKLPIEQKTNTLQQSPSKITQTVKQNNQQIKQKYDMLLQMITKPIKQIFMQYDEIDSYLNKFYNQLPHEVKEMIPYSRKQIESIFREKKVDIFEGYNFGLYRPKDHKFTLFGSIQCVPVIASKYGQIQVEQVYLFNKNNGYQKQYLSKQIKIFEKIGYVYQKKTEQEGIYTIKFIVKIPKQSKKEVSLKDQLEIKAILHFQQHSSTQTELIKNNCIYYMLGKGLSQILDQKQKVNLSQQNNMQSKYLLKKIKDPIFSNNIVKTEVINHNIVQVSINLPIKYIQTTDQPFFTLQVVQYVIKATQQKIYLALFQENNLAIVIHQMKDSDVPQGFTLQTFIQSKFKKMEKISELFLFLPVWQNSRKYYYKGNTPKPFSYLQKTHANLVYGSIVKSKVHKGDFIFLEPPFAFIIFQITSSQVLKRMLFGHVVKEDEILKLKRVVN